MKLLEHLSNQQLEDLSNLHGSVSYQVLQLVRSSLIAEMKERTFVTIDTDIEKQLLHAKQLGHVDAWKLDDGIVDLAKKELQKRNK